MRVIFAIVDYSIELISIETYAPQFIGHNKTFLGSVEYYHSKMVLNNCLRCLNFKTYFLFGPSSKKLRQTNFSFLRSVNLKSNFVWNSMAQKMNKILDIILPYEARAEFCLIFRFLGQCNFKKKYFWGLLTFRLRNSYFVHFWSWEPLLKKLATYIYGNKKNSPPLMNPIFWLKVKKLSLLKFFATLMFFMGICFIYNKCTL